LLLIVQWRCVRDTFSPPSRTSLVLTWWLLVCTVPWGATSSVSISWMLQWHWSVAVWKSLDKILCLSMCMIMWPSSHSWRVNRNTAFCLPTTSARNSIVFWVSNLLHGTVLSPTPQDCWDSMRPRSQDHWESWAERWMPCNSRYLSRAAKFLHDVDGSQIVSPRLQRTWNSSCLPSQQCLKSLLTNHSESSGAPEL